MISSRGSRRRRSPATSAESSGACNAKRDTIHPPFARLPNNTLVFYRCLFFFLHFFSIAVLSRFFFVLLFFFSITMLSRSSFFLLLPVLLLSASSIFAASSLNLRPPFFFLGCPPAWPDFDRRGSLLLPAPRSPEVFSAARRAGQRGVPCRAGTKDSRDLLTRRPIPAGASCKLAGERSRKHTRVRYINRRDATRRADQGSPGPR